MPLKIIFILAALLQAAVLASCSKDSGINQSLSDAEQVMQEHPDSAFYILRDIEPEELWSRQSKARHSLLMSMAFDKNFIDLTTDSLIYVAVKYYSRHRDYERRFLSYYYQGRVYENAKEYNKAILSYTEAEQVIDRFDNDYVKGLLYSHLGILHEKILDYPKGLDYYTKAESFYGDGYPIQKYDSKLCIAEMYMKMNIKEKAVNLITEVLHWAIDNSNEYIVGECEFLLNNWNLHKKGGYSEFLSSYSNGTLHCNVKLARNAADNYKKDSATFYLDRAWHLAANTRDTILMHYYTYKVYKSLGDYKAALNSHEIVLYAQDTLVRTALQQPLITVQRDYYHSQAENRALKLKNIRMLSLCGAVILVLLIALMFLYYHHQLVIKQRNLDDYILLHQELETVLASRNKSIKELFSKQYQLLDKLCKAYYENPRTGGDAAMYRIVAKEIETLRSSKGFNDKFVDVLNKYNDGLLSKLKADMPKLSKVEYRTLCFLYVGFSAKAISIFTGETTQYIHVRKGRIKAQIMKYKPAGWEEVIRYLK